MIGPRLAGSLLAAAGIVLLAAAFPIAAQSMKIPDQLGAIAKASMLDPDPGDHVAVRDVCTRCHVADQFLRAPRSSGRWEQTYARMVRNGAHATPNQIDRIVVYFQRNLTIINVNTSPWDELGPTLGANSETIEKLLRRRAAKKLVGVNDLLEIPGIKPAVVKKLNAKGLLQF